MRTNHLFRRATAWLAVALVATTLAAKAASGQQQPRDTTVGSWSKKNNYSGPRFGLTFLTPAMVDSLKNHNIDAGPVISQFGWQFEREFYSINGGPRALNEIIFLVGGLDRGAFLPSASWIVGVRGAEGLELGAGPNVSPAGVSMVIAAGVNIRNGGMNFPVNFALASSKVGPRMSILTGFTLR